LQRLQNWFLPFAASTSEIFDEDFEATGRLIIWSCSPLAPKRGELLNIESRGRLFELSVVDVHVLTGGWTATLTHQPR
jgi:hypothetical protein